jgi:hypothetical protein
VVEAESFILHRLFGNFLDVVTAHDIVDDEILAVGVLFIQNDRAVDVLFGEANLAAFCGYFLDLSS